MQQTKGHHRMQIQLSHVIKQDSQQSEPHDKLKDHQEMWVELGKVVGDDAQNCLMLVPQTMKMRVVLVNVDPLHVFV